METETKQKWFYPLQEKAEKMLEEKYTRNGYCLFQDVCKDRVYEAWDVTSKAMDARRTQIVIVMHRATGFIQIYESK